MSLFGMRLPLIIEDFKENSGLNFYFFLAYPEKGRMKRFR